MSDGAGQEAWQASGVLSEVPEGRLLLRIITAAGRPRAQWLTAVNHLRTLAQQPPLPRNFHSHSIERPESPASVVGAPQSERSIVASPRAASTGSGRVRGSAISSAASRGAGGRWVLRPGRAAGPGAVASPRAIQAPPRANSGQIQRLSSLHVSTRAVINSLQVQLTLPQPGGISTPPAAPVANSVVAMGRWENSREETVRGDSPSAILTPAPPSTIRALTIQVTAGGVPSSTSSTSFSDGGSPVRPADSARYWFNGLITRIRGLARGSSTSSHQNTAAESVPAAAGRGLKLTLKWRRMKDKPLPGDASDLCGSQSGTPRRCASFVLEQCVCPITQVREASTRRDSIDQSLHVRSSLKSVSCRERIRITS